MATFNRSESIDARHCWVCFVTDEEAPGALWVQPCRCRGSSQWVHVSCLLRWIDEQQQGEMDSTVRCSQCQTPYQLRLPPPNAVEAALDGISSLFTSTSPLIAFLGGVGGFVFCLFKYGEMTMFRVLGPVDTGELVNGSDPLHLVLGFTLLPVALLGVSTFNWEGRVLAGLRWLYPQARCAVHSVWSHCCKALTSRHDINTEWKASEASADAASPCAATRSGAPEIEVNMNRDQQIEATSDWLSQTIVSALTLPFVANFCGQLLFSKAIRGSMKRTICGGLMYILLKGSAKMYLSVRRSARIQHRAVVNFGSDA